MSDLTRKYGESERVCCWRWSRSPDSELACRGNGRVIAPAFSDARVDVEVMVAPQTCSMSATTFVELSSPFHY